MSSMWAYMLGTSVCSDEMSPQVRDTQTLTLFIDLQRVTSGVKIAVEHCARLWNSGAILP